MPMAFTDSRQDQGFVEWFDRQFVQRRHPWKNGVRSWTELPSTFRAVTFTAALADWRKTRESPDGLHA